MYNCFKWKTMGKNKDKARVRYNGEPVCVTYSDVF